MLEPVCYFTFSGQGYALTATEVAVRNKMQTNAGVKTFRSVLTDLTHKNLPLSMFIDQTTEITNQLGLNEWNGSTTARVMDSNIISYLGVGLVIFPKKVV